MLGSPADVIIELHLPVNFGNAEVYDLKSKMVILVKSCYFPFLGRQLMLTLGSSYPGTPHKANISRRAKDSLYHTPHKANISSKGKR